MGYGSAVVLQGVTCPDAAVSIVEMVGVRVPAVLLPCEMTLDDGPHLPHICRVGIKLEMP